MADAAISSLPAISEIFDADLFVLEQNGIAKKLPGAKLTEFINRNVTDVTVYELSPGSEPTAEYNKVTGKLSLGIPVGNSIVSITVDNEGYIVYRFADGKTVKCENIKGDTGKSAYQYAVEQGYEGEETDFAQLQLNLYNASLNEAERVEAENQRKEEYAYMMDTLQERLDNINTLVSKTDAIVIGRRLILNRTDVSYVPRTLFL